MADARKIAAAALLKVETDAAYSNLTLQHALDRTEVGAEDKALATALFYGVLDRKLTLDHILSGKIKTPLSKVRPYTLTVLRMGLYQILYMDKIPDRAAVNESVALIKKSKEARNAGFVNAVLRTAIREGVSLPETDDANALSVRYSCPVPIVESFLADYGKETAIGLLEASLRPAALTVRVNTLKTTPEALCEEFAKKGVSLVPGRPDGCLIAQKGFDIAADPLYKEGYFYAQDAASQQQGVSPGGGGVVAVSQANQQVQRRTGDQAGHLGRAAAHHLVQEGERPAVGVTHGNGPPEEFSRLGDIHELARSRHGVGGLPLQHQAVHVPGQGDILQNGKNALLHGQVLSQESMVEIVRVVSSRTSSNTRTVSREVKMVALFSVAHRRISWPSAAPAEPMCRVFRM